MIYSHPVDKVLTAQNVFGAFLPLASQALFANLGYQWAGRQVTFLNLILYRTDMQSAWLLGTGAFGRTGNPARE